MKSYNTFTLPNGLRIIHQLSASPVCYCGFAINVGSRDEDSDKQGMVHLIEHMLFKGTHNRRAWHILNRMEAVGGELNAYTTKEETMVYSAFLSEHFARAAELLYDIVFHSSFPATELHKEVGVIVDEIRSYADTPSELIYDDFEDVLFCGHQLGHNILGNTDQLYRLNSSDLFFFAQRYYTASNMVFFVRGNIPFKRVVRTLSDLSFNLSHSTTESHRTPPPPLEESLYVSFPRETNQIHTMIGRPSYAATDERRTALYLLNNILGGPGMNSRLNIALRERRGLVYTVESNLTSYTDTGVFNIYYGCDPINEEACMRWVMKELRRMRENKLTKLQLTAAKKQLIGQIGVASDNNENMALSMAKNYLHYNRYDSREEIFARIEALTPEALWDVANEMFDEDILSIVTFTQKGYEE
ncbi:MAG: insulinase family protein [Mediterranea sp.]|jgi:predicted Zn-dependent peptidase|nr:insulinase family protein [Mediterranea sp.]